MTVEIIDFLSMSGWIEESGGRRKFQIVMETDIREFEKRMLCSCECRHALPMYFLSEDHTVKACYDFTGFIQIKEYIKMQAFIPPRENQKLISSVLTILSGTMECLKGLENYLIFPERISIHPDTIFIDLSDNRIVLAAYPNEKPELTLQSRTVELIRELGGLFDSCEVDQYLKEIENFILTKNPGLDGMIGFLGSMEREVSYIYWDTKNFRKIEEPETLPVHSDVKKSRKKDDFRLKTLVIQIILAFILLAVFLSNKLDIANFAGLAIITGAVDLLMLKKQKILDSKNI